MKQLRWHPTMTPARWVGYSRERQILIIGSEFARAVNLLKASAVLESKICIARAMELLDLNLTDPQWGGRRMREVLRFREMLGSWYLESKPSQETLAHLFRIIMEWNGATARVQR